MKTQRLAPLLVVVAGLLAYHNSFTGGFFLDDLGSIPDNRTIEHLWPVWRALSPPHHGGLTVEGRPLINFSLAINYALGGYNVWGYHALNLTVHILAGLTLFGIVRRTLLRPALRARFGAAANELALVTAVLWTVHPLQTESVTYIVQRAESIMGLFYLLTLYGFIRGVESVRARLWYGLSATACALGMVSKEVMVSAPVMVLLYDHAFVSSSFREAWRRRWPLYLALASTWVLLGVVLVIAGNFATASMLAQRIGHSRWGYLATEPGVILYYLRLSLWPSPLYLIHPWFIAKTWMSILLPTVGVMMLMAASAWAWRRNPAWGFLGAWFFLILAPSSSFIPLHDLIYEHRMYLPLAAVVSLAVTVLYAAAGRRSLAVFAVVAVGLGFLTWRRNQIYQRNPHYSLGVALERAGRTQEAIGELEQALRTTPNDPWAHYILGVALREANRIPEAISHWEQAVRIDPDFAEAHYNLGLALVVSGGLENVPAAIEQWEQAVRINSGYAQAHYNLGVALARLGRGPEAVAHFEEALRIDPDYAEAHNNLGSILAQLGRVPEAIEHFRQALRIDPDMAEAHKNLGVALMGLGRVPEAVAHFERALRINPDYAEAHYSLGVALAQLGRMPEAIGQYEEALRIKPDYAEAKERLARLQPAR
ncbi:MAG TPA: tetratricopeptide repeat protein [Verrucomicrobiae bacterium]|nr:tetratricopeptide repeat protein [Verrucomicrobiae bacterium]